MAKQKPSQPAKPTPPSGGGPDLAKQFMRENPPGKLADPVEPRAEVAPSFPEANSPRTLFESEHPAPAEPVAEVAAPAAPEATVDADGTPLATGGETAPVAEVAPVEGAVAETPEGEAPKAVKPEDTPGGPIGGEKPAEAAPATPVAAKVEPSYAPDEVINLVPGSEGWTREQIVTRLQQSFTELEPKAREADQFHSLFGGNFADAEARWKPTLEKLAENPARTAALEKLLSVGDQATIDFVDRVASNPDPALLDYLQRSEQHFYSPDGGGFQRPPAPAAPAAKLAEDPRIAHAVSVAQQMEGQLAVMRANNERAQVFMQYPVVQHNEKVRQALFSRASEMYGQDEKAGKPLGERRGLLDAVKENQAFLEMAMIAARQASPPSPAIEPRPGVGAEALLPGTGPGALGTTRQAPPREYTGPKENAKAAFLEAYPE